ncbi:MAG: hypothetical protein ACJ73C_13490, partial [Nitrososphaeraceae archaeon]
PILISIILYKQWGKTEKNFQQYLCLSLAAAIVLILTGAIVTPLAAFAYSLRVPSSSGTDDVPSVISAADRNANTPDGESIARVKPPTDLQVPSNSGTARVAPISRNIAALGDEWWNWAFSIDTNDVGNPFTDTTGEFCDLGIQKGNLLFLVGTAGEVTTSGGTSGHTGDVRTCATPIPRGTTIFFPLLNTECSTLEGNGKTEAELRACATDIINHVDIDSLTLTIDGVPSDQLAKRVQSGPGGFQLTVVPNNPFGVQVSKPTTTLSVSDGYWALLKATSLRPGKHTITFGGEANFPEFDFTFRTEVTYKIVVK